MRSIDQVIENNMCTGCGLCSSSPEMMKMDVNGFLRPLQPIDDAISINHCPSISICQSSVENYDPMWGPVIESFTGFSGDDRIRRKGSSGGVLTSILSFVLTKGLVDQVIQIGISEDDPIKNAVKLISEPADLINNAGSRYAPSAPLAIIRSLLNNGKKYAVVAKPCDIAALRSLINSSEPYRKQFPVLLSFMCAGVPSEQATEDVLETLKVDRHELVSFRYRGNGWPGLTTAIDKNGTSASMSYNDSWGNILNRKLQSRCKVCADGTGELADIVCADAWHESENGYPSFVERDGRSLILVRTQLGKEILKGAVTDGIVRIEDDFLIENITPIQPYQAKRKRAIVVRKFALIFVGMKSPSYTGFKLFYLLFRTNPIVSLKEFYGTLIRGVRKTF